MPKVFSKCLITRSLNSPEVSLIALNIKIGGRRMKHNFRTQLPPVVYRAYVLEQQSASYLLSTHLTEQAALDRLAAEQRKFDPRCQEVCWLYVLTDLVPTSRPLRSEQALRSVVPSPILLPDLPSH